MPRLPIKWGISLPNRGALFGLTDVDELIETAEVGGTVRCLRVGLVRRQLDSQAALGSDHDASGGGDSYQKSTSWHDLHGFIPGAPSGLAGDSVGVPRSDFPEADRCSASASAAGMKVSSALSA